MTLDILATGETLTLRALSRVQAGRAVRYAGEGYVTPAKSNLLGVAISDATACEDVRVLVSGTLRVGYTFEGQPRVGESGAIGVAGTRHYWISWERPGVLRLFPPFEGARGRLVRSIIGGDR